MSFKAPEHYLRGTHLRIAEILGSQSLTAYEIAQRLDSTFEAVTSCLRGMRNRGEVVALKPKKVGTPYKYRLKRQEAAA